VKKRTIEFLRRSKLPAVETSIKRVVNCVSISLRLGGQGKDRKSTKKIRGGQERSDKSGSEKSQEGAKGQREKRGEGREKTCLGEFQKEGFLGK